MFIPLSIKELSEPTKVSYSKTSSGFIGTQAMLGFLYNGKE